MKDKKQSKIEDIRNHNHILTPGRYVGTEEEEDDGVLFEDKMKELTTKLKEQMDESERLDKEIKKNLKSIGFGI